MQKLITPLKISDIQNLKAGDEVLLNGTIFAARDRAHEFFLDNNFEQIQGGIIYHCGPIVDGEKVVAAGPTTSQRLNIFTPQLIQKYDIKAIVGKGGMDEKVLEAMRGKAVYLAAIGGAGVLYAKNIKLKNIYKKEFGMSDAIYEFEVNNFPLIVGMDAHGESLYKKVNDESNDVFKRLLL